ncbi:tetratricopeptide repeat protein [Pelosinus sp. sgz500959]|uniref:tetratricopeptide repeat protein n=1 Tax=Pelosinus sp. sgz500959 TaxID=3242472 RepID=UPI00366E98DD
MKKNKIVWSLFSTILMSNTHSVDAATPPPIEEKVAIANNGKVSIDSIVTKAAALINKGLPEQAIVLLQPYMKDKIGVDSVQETYMEAIFKSGTYDVVIEEGNRIWPQRAKMPVSMQKMLAESYLRLGKSTEALTIFRTLAETQPQDQDVKANLAYTLVYSGQTFEGLGVYNQLLRNHPDMAGIFVEDAIALLSQGNILGGRSLFENILTLCPEKIEYRQRYADTLAIYNMEGIVQTQYKKLAKVQNIPESEQRRQRHEKAIELARAQQFSESLSILRWLHETELTDESITFDYITVLHWSGNEEAAIKLYEQLPNSQIPDYVQQNMVDAYDNSGDYHKALIVLRSLPDQSNRKTKLREAEFLMRLGEESTAQVIYEELLSLDPKDAEVYLSRASLTVSMEAAWNLEQALRFIPRVPKNEMGIRQIKADLASEYIRLNQPTRAISLLIPYINDKTASNSMQGDYILALKTMGNYKLVTAEAKRLWPDYAKAPLFALGTVAESYIQLKQFPKAIALYQQMIAIMPDDLTDQRNLAFNLMLEGRLIQGLEVYHQLMMKQPDQAMIAVQDATLLLATEKYVIGKSLFELISNLFPSNTLYRRQYADMLAKNSLYQSAYTQYESVSRTPDFQVIGLTGMVRMALALDDYKKAKILLETLEKNYGRSKAVAAVANQYDEQKKGQVDQFFSSNTSYKQTQTRSWDVTAKQYVKENYSIMTGMGSTRFDDFSTNEHQVVKNKMLAVRYNDLYQKTELRYDMNDFGNSFGTFTLSSEQSLPGELSIKLEVGRSLVSDVQALSQASGPVFFNNYGMTLTKNLSKRENIEIGINRSLYNDGNQSSGYSLDHNYTLYIRGDDTLTRNLYWNRTWFGMQDLVYESPALRESLGAGWTLKRNAEKGYWQGQIVANWDRDYPDRLAFNPYARLEYHHDFSENHSLMIGAEYGLKTENALGKGGFHFEHRQFDALYTITW